MRFSYVFYIMQKTGTWHWELRETQRSRDCLDENAHFSIIM